MAKLDEQIKNGRFAKVYLLYGEEDYLVEFQKKKLIKAIIPEGDDFNLNVWQDKELDMNQLIEQAQTLPFFADHRLIVVEDSGIFKKGPQAEQLLNALPTFPEETILLFAEKEAPDARGKLYKAVKEIGHVEEFKYLREEDLERWVVRRLDRTGRKIQRSALQLFLERTGDDMRNIVNELEKLICYTDGKDAVYLEDVQKLTTMRLENRIFEMCDAIAAKNPQKALLFYEELLSLKEPPLRILALLFRQFERLLQVKELRDRGMDQPTIADKLQMKSFIVRKSINQGTNYTYEELRKILDTFGQADMDIKSGKMKDTLAVELVIVQAAT